MQFILKMNIDDSSMKDNLDRPSQLAIACQLRTVADALENQKRMEFGGSVNNYYYEPIGSWHIEG